MNKTMEYMAFELPVVAFDLTETRVSAGDAAVYVEPNDVEKYARAIVELARRRAAPSADGPRSGANGSSRCSPGSTRPRPTSRSTTDR